MSMKGSIRRWSYPGAHSKQSKRGFHAPMFQELITRAGTSVLSLRNFVSTGFLMKNRIAIFMMKIDRNRALILLSLAVVAILSTSVLTAYASGNGRPRCNLTDEQRETIRLKVQEMREAGAGRKEIRSEITAMLWEWGIEAPECQGPRNGMRPHKGPDGHPSGEGKPHGPPERGACPPPHPHAGREGHRKP